MKETIIILVLSIFLYICFKLMRQQIQIEYKENLTMDKNSITITIDNYCGQRITFTMSEDAEIESLFELDTNLIKITHVSINAYDSDILIEKEDI